MNLTVENGAFSYAGNLIFSNIQVSLNRHEILAILGPNGAGKTTLLKCIMNILPWEKGTARLDSTEIRKLPRKKLWQMISYVPQAKSAPFGYTVREMILLGRSAHLSPFAQPGKEDLEIVEKVMDELRISHLTDHSCRQISGGELQLVLIGRALAVQPKLLIMDEPESNLDYHNQLLILDLISKLSGQMSCIINTHYPDHALRIAHKALLMSKEGLCIYGKTSDVITEQNLEKAFNIKVKIGQFSTSGHSRSYIIPVAIHGNR